MLDLQCPQCKSSSVRLVAPTAAELMSFKCNDCGRSWSERILRGFRAASTQPEITKRRARGKKPS